MTTKDLEQAIIDLIQDTYKLCYNKHLYVKQTFTKDGKPKGYELTLDLDNYEKPLKWSFDCDEKTFLKMVKKELYETQLCRADYFTGYKYEKEDECPK